MSRALKITFSLALLMACGRHSSSHPTPAPIAKNPGLTQPGSTAGSDQPTTPVTTGPATQPTTNTPPATNPGAATDNPGTTNPGATNPDAKNPGTTNPGPTTQPTPGSLPAEVQALWGIGLAQKPRSCATYYDFRGADSLSLHVLCPNASGQGLWLQTEKFSVVSAEAHKTIFKRLSSTCATAPAQSNLILDYAINKDRGRRTLTLTENQSSTPGLKEIAPETLAGDLSKATELHGKPVVRGCFMDGRLSKFAEGKAAQ